MTELASRPGRSAVLEGNELDAVRSLVRQEIRRVERKRRASRAKYGEEYDDRHNVRLAYLEQIYRRLGGDPANIENRRHGDE